MKKLLRKLKEMVRRFKRMRSTRRAVMRIVVFVFSTSLVLATWGIEAAALFIGVVGFIWVLRKDDED